MSHLNNDGLRQNKTTELIMLIFKQLPNYIYDLLEMSSVWKLGSRTSGNIAVYRDKLDK